MLGNSGLQLRPTQQHKGLWEQSKCTSAGLPPARAVCRGKSKRVGIAPPPPLFFICSHWIDGCLLRSSLEPKLREGRTSVSVVPTVAPAQGLAHGRCSVRKEGTEERGATEHEGGCGQDKGNRAAISPSGPSVSSEPL